MKDDTLNVTATTTTTTTTTRMCVNFIIIFRCSFPPSDWHHRKHNVLNLYTVCRRYRGIIVHEKRVRGRSNAFDVARFWSLNVIAPRISAGAHVHLREITVEHGENTLRNHYGTNAVDRVRRLNAKSLDYNVVRSRVVQTRFSDRTTFALFGKNDTNIRFPSRRKTGCSICKAIRKVWANIDVLKSSHVYC